MSILGHLAVTVHADAVVFAFTVENSGPEPVTLEFRNGKTADVVVYDDDLEVWRWSDGRMFSQAIRTRTIAPGETITNEMAWEEPSPGRYVAEGILEATNEPLSKRTTFELPATVD